MKPRLSANFFVILLTLIGFSSGYILGQSPWAPVAAFGASTSMPPSARETFAPFWETWNLVHARYFDQPVDDNALAEGAISGMLAALGDPNTRYLPPDAEAAARTAFDGEIEGIGATVESVDGNITIVAPMDGSPAQAAGLLPGDILRQANGVDLTGLDALDAALLVRGPAGTPVTLLVERDGRQFEVVITREVIKLDSVRSKLLNDRIGYIRISRFGTRTGEEVADALRTLLSKQPVGLIIDLRSNPGGALSTAIEVADQFLPEGPILIERFGDGRERVHNASGRGLAQELPLAVLIDEGSASASEVLAGAIRDRERGVLIGQTSFGKGTVQTWHTLSNHGGVRITIARWLTPDDVWVHGRGLQPDYFIPQPEGRPQSPSEDAQLQAAVDFLLGREIISFPPSGENSSG
ncbi:MAG: S41 family peptidase [Anaerolineae bacterium]